MSAGATGELRMIAAEIAAAAGSTDAWLVGGVVRDALLGRPLIDIDIVVRRDPQEVARACARSWSGSAFCLSSEHGCWRVVWSVDGDERQLDVCPLQGGSIEADLTLRDYTCNALAIPIGETDRLIDVGGGEADLRDRVLRAVSAAALDDDPLRMLRAARMSHTLGMTVEPQTQALIRQRRMRAVEPSGERTFAELCALLDAPEQRRGIRLLDELGLVEPLLPELHACRGIEQSRYHHLDVFEHTLAVLDNTEDLAAEPAFYLGDDCADPAWPSDASRRTLAFAALLHDVGKPDTCTIHPASGRVSFLGHDRVGADMVRSACARWSTSNRFRDDVAHLVHTHLALGMLLHGAQDRRERWQFLRLVEPVAAEAIVLSVSDRLATAGVDDRRRWVRSHQQVARAVWRDWWEEQRVGTPQPLLTGTEIAEVCGVAPGPALGRLVRALAEQQGIGLAVSRDDAVAFVQRVSAERGDDRHGDHQQGGDERHVHPVAHEARTAFSLPDPEDPEGEQQRSKNDE